MELEHGIFAVKLCELEREYGRLQSRMQLFQGKKTDQVRQERERLQDEYHEHDLLLGEMAASCRSHAMAGLAALQRDYERQVEALLQAGVTEQPGNGCTDSQDRAETMTLYAEFTLDFATQMMRHALITALNALELQMQADEQTTKGENNHE